MNQKKIKNTHNKKKKKKANKSKNNKKRSSKKIKANNHKSPTTKSNRIIKIIGDILFYLIMLSLLIGAGLLAITQQNGKSFNGYRMFGVLTDSMVAPGDKIKKGGFRSGDILVVKEVEPEDVKVGDVITYKLSTNKSEKNTSFLTHRIVEILDHLNDEKGIFYVTQGDANKTRDMPISSKALVGKEAFVIPKIGGIITYVKDNMVISFVFIFSILGFIWVCKTYIFVEVPTKKRRH